MQLLSVYWDVQKPNIYCRITLGKKRGIHVTASGFAKCNVMDKWNESTGKELAITRALCKAMKKYRTALEESMREPEEAMVAAVNSNGQQPKQSSDLFSFLRDVIYGKNE